MIYADHAATTPLDTQVLAVMKPYFNEQYFNPSSLYTQAQHIRKAIENARFQVADLIGAEPEEVIFTSGGTEADNAAIKGLAFALRDKGRHLITTQIEHHAVLASFQFLETQGFEVTYLPVDHEFRVSVEDFRNAIRPDTVMASVMMANNETGTIQPISKLVQIAKENHIIFHTDAVQAVTTCSIDVKELGVDALSISSHKIYGPKGAGALFLRAGTPWIPWISGGDQESGRRGGTESVANLIGFGQVARLVKMHRKEWELHAEKLRVVFVRELENQQLEFLINGARTGRLAHIVNVGLRNMEGEAVLMHLMLRGILASLGAACHTSTVEPSHVLEAGNVERAYIRGSVRFSFGKDTTDDEVIQIASELGEIIKLIQNVDQ